MYCRKCGKELGAEHNFCMSCGEPVVNREIGQADGVVGTNERYLFFSKLLAIALSPVMLLLRIVLQESVVDYSGWRPSEIAVIPDETKPFLMLFAVAVAVIAIILAAAAKKIPNKNRVMPIVLSVADIFISFFLITVK